MPFPFTLAFQTAGDVGEALPFGLTIEALQRWTLIYLGLSSLVFVVVWVVGYLRR
ncbi:MAG: cytochrome B6 [Cyanobium sp.]